MAKSTALEAKRGPGGPRLRQKMSRDGMNSEGGLPVIDELVTTTKRWGETSRLAPDLFITRMPLNCRF